MRINTPALSAICLLFSIAAAGAATTHSSTEAATTGAMTSGGTARGAAIGTAGHGTNSATASPTGAANLKADEFTTEAAAKQSCGSNPVVWVNTSSKVIHPAGDKYFGKTKHGAFMCQNTAEKDGFHLSGQKTATKG